MKPNAPVSRRFAQLHYVGVLALVFLVLETVTGILLMTYYRPSATAAYYSTGIITDDVRFGWLIRALHHWGANLLILLAFTHLFQVYFSRAYQAGRRNNWIVGLALLVLVVTAGFTGTLLPWDQYAYWYIDSARATISSVPVLGNAVLGLIWGGWEIGEEVLLRFYAFHVGVLPWLALAFLLLHLFFVWRLSLAEAATTDSAVASPSPAFVTNLAILALLVGGVLLTLAVVFPPLLAEQANPLVPLPHPEPPWYLLPVRGLLRGLPGGMAALAVIGLVLLFLLVPVVDRHASISAGKKMVHRLFGILAIVAWVLLGIRGYWQ